MLSSWFKNWVPTIDERKALQSRTTGLVKTTIYQADRDGFVVAFHDTVGTDLRIFVDGFTPPTTQRAGSGNGATSLCCPVLAGEYWKITHSQTPTVQFVPAGEVV